MLGVIRSVDFRSVNTIVFLCLVYYLIMCFLVPGFFTVHNSWNLLYNLLPLLIAAIGQTYVIITAGIDLSLTSAIAFSSVVGGFLMSADTGLDISPLFSILLAVIAMLAAGASIGVVNGISVTTLGMPSFMVTLTTMMLFSGLAVWLTKSQNMYNLPELFVNMPYSAFLGIPIPFIIGAVVVFIAYFLLNKTVMGEWLYAVGMNPKASRISGVHVSRTLVFAYVFSGVCAAVASILYTARLETGSPVMGQHILLDVIGAVVIGGTSLFGGKGKIQWTLFGALFITLLDNSLNLLGLSYFIIMVVKGAVILLATLLNVWKSKSFKTTV